MLSTLSQGMRGSHGGACLGAVLYGSLLYGSSGTERRGVVCWGLVRLGDARQLW